MADDSLASPRFRPGERVRNVTGDYTFEGVVVSLFAKRNGVAVRYVVENGDGILHIFSAKNLEVRNDE